MSGSDAIKWIVLILVAILGVLLGANGILMLALPETWFYQVPGVARTGFFNQHLVRDLGMLYVLIGVALIVGVLRPYIQCGLWGASAIWLTGHAIFHFTEVATGICGAANLATDFPGVTLPAMISIIATIWAARQTMAANAP